jgi:hypothetical protein
MIRTAMLTIVLSLTAALCVAQAGQQPSSVQSSTQMRVQPGVNLRVELVKTIDAKKAKPGEPVVVKTVDELMAGNRVASPKGTKIYGHVVSAAPHHGDTPSTLEIAFDKIGLGSEEGVPMKAIVQAISQPVQVANAGYGSMAEQPTAGTSPMGSPAGGRLGGGSPPTASTPNNGGLGTTGAQGASPAPSSGRIPLNAQGVIGMSGVSLTASPQGDSTITSEKHNVKLDGGTQMILRVTQ